jgi:uridine kinase
MNSDQNISTNEQEFRRARLRTLTFLLLEAIHDNHQLKIAFSLGDGYYFHLGSKRAPYPSEVLDIKKRMQKSISENRSLNAVSLEKKNVLKFFKKSNQKSSHAWIKDIVGDIPPLYNLKDEIFAFKGPLLESTGDVGQWDLVTYPPGILLRIPPVGYTKLTKMHEHPTLFRAFYEGEQWGRIYNARYLSEVNAMVSNGSITQLIQVAEALQDRTISRIADRIFLTMPRPQVVFVSGPSSSGKTSFSMRLSTHLKLLGLTPFPIGLDNYYHPRSKIPRTSDGDYDYEAFEAIDSKYFNETMLRLISGERVKLPELDFASHDRKEGEEIQIDQNGILIVEGIHGLNPGLTEHLTKASAFKVYVSALSHLNFDRLNRVSTTDIRMLRRLVRDQRSRGTDADGTINRWPKVREGELKHIFPFQEEADVMFNSALPFELNALKPLALKTLKASKDKSIAPEIERIKNLLDSVKGIKTSLIDRHLPPTSILREFTGGSVLVE